MSTDTHERAEPATATEQRRRSWWVTALIGLLALALGIGVGYWLFGTDDEGAAQDVPADVEQLIDDWLVAWGEGDMDAILSLMTANARFDSMEVDDPSPAGFVSRMTPMMKESKNYEVVDVIVRDSMHSGAPYEVAYEFRAGFDDLPMTLGEGHGLELLLLVEDDGVLKIATVETAVG